MEWIPAISTTSLFAVALFLSRNLIITRLNNSIKHEYNEKLEALKTNFKKNEERLRADLNAKAAQIDALRAGALSGVINRHAVLYNRKLQAVEDLWEEVVALSPAKVGSTFLPYLNYEKSMNEASQNPKFAESIGFLVDRVDLEKLRDLKAQKTRPFISELAWAYFSAYLSIIIYSIAKLKALGNAIISIESIIDSKKVTELFKTALPQHLSHIEESGPNMYPVFLDMLEKKILSEIKNILEDRQADEKSIELAAAILKQAEQLNQSEFTSQPDMQAFKDIATN